MAADHAPDQPLMREMIEAAILAVTLPGGIDQRQVARLAMHVRCIALAGEIKLFQRQRDFLREPDTNKAAGGDGVAIANEAHRLRGRHDLAFLRIAQIGQSRMRAHGFPPDCFNRMPGIPNFAGGSTFYRQGRFDKRPRLPLMPR